MIGFLSILSLITGVEEAWAVMRRTRKIFLALKTTPVRKRDTQWHHLLSKTFWIHTSLTLLKGDQAKAIQTQKAPVKRNQEIIRHGIRGWRQQDLTVRKNQTVRTATIIIKAIHSCKEMIAFLSRLIYLKFKLLGCRKNNYFNFAAEILMYASF